MSHHEPEIVEVSTTRLGPARRSGSAGARRPVSVVLVILAAIAIPAYAVVGPRIEWRPQIDLSLIRPSDAAPSPMPTPSPPRRTPAPTSSPLPELTVGDGERPGRIAIDVGGIRFIDPSTGGLTSPGSIHLENDAVVPAPNGGWWCVCLHRIPVTSDKEKVEISVRHLDRSAVETARFPIRSTVSTAPVPAQDLYTRFEVEYGPDGRTAYVVSAVRAENRWTVALEALDLAEGASLGRAELGTVDVTAVTVADANQGYEPWLGGPTMRLSPDGRRLIVGAWVEQPSPTGQPAPPDAAVWLVEVASRGGGPIGAVAPVTGPLHDVFPSCAYAMQWLTADSLLGACSRQTDSVSGPPILLTTYGLDGSAGASVGYTPDESGWTTDPILDRANRVVYYWSPVGHALDAIDLERGRVDHVSVDPDVESVAPHSTTGRRADPDWTTMFSDYAPWMSPQFFGEPGGRRLYALGLVENAGSDRGGNYGSSGIWVFDAAALQLTDHWPAAAAYTGIKLTRDGRWIVAIGQQDVDPAGNPTAWPMSVSIHDARDGRLALQTARIGRDVGVLFVP